MIGTSGRRGALVTAAALAGAGASLSFFALSHVAPSASASLVNQSATVPVAGLLPALPAVAPAAAPAAPAVPRPVAPKAAPMTMPMTAPSTPSACTGTKPAAGAFMQHLEAAHLETSPVQQVSDATDVDAYTKAHTVLLGSMLAPLVGGLEGSTDSFLQHVYAAHLGESPTEQVADAADPDQYVKTHTVMAQNMITPLVGC
jgi:hypothetical protein